MYTINICYFNRDFHHIVFKHVFENMCFISKLNNSFELCYIENENVIKIQNKDLDILLLKGMDFCKRYFNSRVSFRELKTNESLMRYGYKIA